MALRVITGAANSGKSGLAYVQMRTAAQSGMRALILVPSAPDVPRVVREVSSEFPLGIAVHAFDDYLDRLWVALGDGRRIARQAQRLLVLAEIGRSLTDGHGAALVASDGALSVLASFVQRAASMRTSASMPPAAGPVAVALLELGRSYSRALAGSGLVERGEAHRLVLERLTEAELPAMIVVNHMSDLSAAQERFVVRASQVTDVVISLTFDESVSATWATRALVERLSRSGTREVTAGRSYTAPAELRALETALGGPPPTPLAPAGAIVISEAWGEDAEAARIVRETQDAIADGIPPGRIAIVYRDPAIHMRTLATAFAEAGIAVEWDLRVPITHSGLGRALLAALRFEASGHTNQIDLLRSPYSPVAADVADALDVRARQTQMLPLPEMERWLAARDPEGAAFVRFLRRALLATGTADGVAAWHRVVNGMLGCAWRDARKPDPALLLDADAARAFMEAVAAACLMGDGAADTTALASAVSRSSIAIAAADNPERVQVMGAERARARRFECVIVGGLTAAEFPGSGRDDVFSSPALARDLRDAGVGAAPRRDLEAERLLFYQVVTRASRRLVLSRQSHDAQGRPQPPSIFLDEVLDLYRWDGDGERNPLRQPDRLLRPADLTRGPAAPMTTRRELRALVASGCGSSDVDTGQLTRLADARRRAGEAVRASDADSIDGLSDAGAISVTDIETYIVCPRRWYVERVLRPRELDSRSDGSDAGRLAHEIMRSFYGALASRTRESRLTPSTLDAARDLHATVAGEALNAHPPATVLEELSARRVIQGTLRLIEQDAVWLPGLDPVHHEWSFGTGAARVEFGGFALAGRIDRIDVGPAGLVITDYKLGARDATSGHLGFAASGLVQLPLYAAAASRLLGIPILGGVYRSVQRGRPRGFVRDDIFDRTFVSTDKIDAEGIAALVDSSIELAAEAVAGMRSGCIDPQPPADGCPAYCGARAFCRERRVGRDRA